MSFNCALASSDCFSRYFAYTSSQTTVAGLRGIVEDDCPTHLLGQDAELFVDALLLGAHLTLHSLTRLGHKPRPVSA